MELESVVFHEPSNRQDAGASLQDEQTGIEPQLRKVNVYLSLRRHLTIRGGQTYLFSTSRHFPQGFGVQLPRRRQVVRRPRIRHPKHGRREVLLAGRGFLLSTRHQRLKVSKELIRLSMLLRALYG